MTVPPLTIGPTRGPLLSRLAAALTLRRDFYRAAAEDRTATGPAGAIVSLVALLRESVLIWELSQVERLWGLILPVLVIVALVAWLLLGGVAWVLTRPGLAAPPDLRRLLRCLGFAQTPTALLATLAAFSDPIAYLIGYALVMLWTLAGLVVALQAATDLPLGAALLRAVPLLAVQGWLLVVGRQVALG